MAPWNPETVYFSQAAAFRHGDRFVKSISRDMSLGFCKQDAAARTQGVVNLREEPSAIVNFMKDGEQQGKVDLVVEVRDAKGARVAPPNLDPVEEVCAARPARQRIQHRLLEVHADHAATWTNESRQGQAEEPHGAPDVQHTHPRRNVRTKNFLGVLKQRPDRIGQQVAHPDRTDVMTPHIYCWRDMSLSSMFTDSRAPNMLRAPKARGVLVEPRQNDCHLPPYSVSRSKSAITVLRNQALSV